MKRRIFLAKTLDSNSEVIDKVIEKIHIAKVHTKKRGRKAGILNHVLGGKFMIVGIN